MLDCERKGGGFRGHFWQAVAQSNGDTVWYSPVFHRASLSVRALCAVLCCLLCAVLS